ncbi:MAG: Hsp20/alpha crystallin family protein [Methanosarcinales archaeon]|nr:MAG: Hsp20/alpha crystallin family protein [Methanosarcinales archaeon]
MKKRRRSPFDIFGDDWSEIFGDDIYEIFERLRERMMSGEWEKPCVYGFSMTNRPGEEPEIREFGNIHPHADDVEVSERRPIVDVFESDDEVKVVVEMPGIDKDDIKLDTSETSLDISAKTRDREYSERVALPARVDSNSAKANYKNGVLEVTLKRVEPKEKKAPIKVE